MFKPKTKNQAEYLKSIELNQITFCLGPGGTGKTHLACAMAADSLLKDQVEKIVLIRPIIESGRGIGFLPGDMLAKVNSYMIPCFDELSSFLNVDNLLKEKKIEVAPPEFLRGRNFHKSFVIVDEAQNLTYKQIVLILSRIGRETKMVLNGDQNQCDISNPFLEESADALYNMKDIGVIFMENSDIVRNKIIGNILKKLKNAYLHDQGSEWQEGHS